MAQVTTPITSGMTNYVPVLEQVRVQSNANETALSGKQASDAELNAIAGLTSSANTLPYFTGSGTAALTGFTAAARTVLDDATTADMLNTLGTGAMITANTTLTVGTAASGATYLDLGSVFSYLATKTIADNVTVTVSVISDLTNQAYSSVTEAQERKVMITGDIAPTTTSITSVGTVTGTAGAYAVPLTLSDATSIAVGDYVVVYAVTASSKLGDALAGHWEVTNVSGSIVTVTNTYRTTWPTFTFTSATLQKPLRKIHFSGGAMNCGWLRRLSIIGSGTLSGPTCRSGTLLAEDVHVSKFVFGFNLPRNNLLLQGAACSACNNSSGIYAANNCMVSVGNSGVLGALIINGGSSFGINASIISAFFSSAVAVIVCGNTSRGIHCADGAKIILDNSSASGNTTDYYAAWRAYIRVTGFAYPSSTFSPAVNTDGNEGGYINT